MPRKQEDPMATPTAQQVQINELFQAHEAMATPREQEDPMATPTAQQLQINELFQAHEAMATPRALKDPKATPTAQQVQNFNDCIVIQYIPSLDGVIWLGF